MQVLVTGASGSGTTTLGKALAARIGADFVDTDDLFWMPTEPPYQARRASDERLRLMRARLAISPSAVVAGSVQGWGVQVEDAFGLIVFLQVPADVRIPRLRQRELARLGRVDEAFIAWAAQYDEGGMEGRSLSGQLAWLDSRRCPVVRLVGALALDDSVGRVLAQLDRLQQD